LGWHLETNQQQTPLPRPWRPFQPRSQQKPACVPRPRAPASQVVCSPEPARTPHAPVASTSASSWVWMAPSCLKSRMVTPLSTVRTAPSGEDPLNHMPGTVTSGVPTSPALVKRSSDGAVAASATPRKSRFLNSTKVAAAVAALSVMARCTVAAAAMRTRAVGPTSVMEPPGPSDGRVMSLERVMVLPARLVSKVIVLGSVVMTAASAKR
jgi:hypothetical protein